MSSIIRSPEATEFADAEGHPWLRLNCRRVATHPRFCDYCEFPRFNQLENDDPHRWLPEPGTPGHDGEVTRDTPPTADPDGVDPGSSGGLL
jgi:hypothetical protein